jgi:hypothetical protein
MNPFISHKASCLKQETEYVALLCFLPNAVGLGEEEGEIAVKKSENISKYFPSTLQPK